MSRFWTMRLLPGAKCLRTDGFQMAGKTPGAAVLDRSQLSQTKDAGAASPIVKSDSPCQGSGGGRSLRPPVQEGLEGSGLAKAVKIRLSGHLIGGQIA